MSKEEKNAIEWLKKADWFSARLYSPTILNLIETQQKEIHNLEQELEQWRPVQTIAEQQKEIEELKEKNGHITKETVDFVNTHYIGKGEIKAKIEEIDNILKNNRLIDKLKNYFEAQKEVLQSLLEKKE